MNDSDNLTDDERLIREQVEKGVEEIQRTWSESTRFMRRYGVSYYSEESIDFRVGWHVPVVSRFHSQRKRIPDEDASKLNVSESFPQ